MSRSLLAGIFMCPMSLEASERPDCALRTPPPSVRRKGDKMRRPSFRDISRRPIRL
jgi:hypothetical protein